MPPPESPCDVVPNTDQNIIDKSCDDLDPVKGEVEKPSDSLERRPSLAEVNCNTETVINCDDQKTDGDAPTEEKTPQQPQGKPPREKGERRKKAKGTKKGKTKDKLKKGSLIQAKFELPEEMVKAHQAAYAYLNPNISRYETLLGLLDQAAQTHLSLQPMVTMVALRYDEINKTLEEMAMEGEKMLAEHGEHMAWPGVPKKAPLPPGVKRVGEHPNLPQNVPAPPPPPDLLQQLLQHSTEKMRLVGESVTGLSDSALEEAVEYFASLSGLLGDKLTAKRTAEGRLKQVLARVEAAAVCKLGLEDSALHSEDSGIGGENESLTGSERHRHHRESCASFGLQSALNRALVPHGEDEEDDDDEEEDDEDDDDEEEGEGEEAARDQDGRGDRRQSNCSLPSRCLRPNNPRALGQTPAASQPQRLTSRPKTADTTQVKPSNGRLRGPRRSRSLENLHCQMTTSCSEPSISQWSVIQRHEGPGNASEASGASNSCKIKLRRHSSASQSFDRGYRFDRSGGQSAAFPVLAPQPPGRHAVKRLITTFSHGVSDKPSVPPHVKINRKCHFPMVSNGYSSFRRGSSSEKHDDVDVDSLPPPPPELLMDSSHNTTQGRWGREEDTDNGGANLGRLTTCHARSSVSQKLRASVPSMTVLPNRGSIQQGSVSLSSASRADAEQDQANDVEREEAERLCRQPRKIIHQRDEVPSSARPGAVWTTSATPAGIGSRQNSSDQGGEGDTLIPPPSAVCPPTTPPVSRARVPPSCPAVCPSIPTPPPCPPGSQWGASAPLAPITQRWPRGNNASDGVPVVASVSFASARSVFSQDPSSAVRSTAVTSTLPRPWGESSRGRLPTTRGLQPFNRRGSTEQKGAGPLNTARDEPDVSATQPQETN